MTFTIDNFEAFILILVRITGFLYAAPFFSLRNVPIRVKTGIAIFMTAILFYNVPPALPDYEGVIGFSILLVGEVIAGVIMGFFSNIAYHIIAFAGEIIDMEIGFSMVSQLDPTTNQQATITANFYGYLITLMMIITNLHHFFIRAIVESFQIIKLGEVSLNPATYQLMVKFLTDYFVIGFRIVLPVYAAILIVNTILAILAKIAPQMNMFVIGLQIKIFVGLVVLILIIELIPAVADFIFEEMIVLLKKSTELLR